MEKQKKDYVTPEVEVTTDFIYSQEDINILIERCAEHEETINSLKGEVDWLNNLKSALENKVKEEDKLIAALLTLVDVVADNNGYWITTKVTQNSFKITQNQYHILIENKRYIKAINDGK